MIASINLPFVDLVVAATSSDEHCLRRFLTLRRATLAPKLPPGMSVDTSIALVGCVKSPSPIYDFTFSLRLARKNATGSRESGEHLEAQGWQIGDGKLMIGTEDGEALRDRIDWYDFLPSAYPMSYLDDGIEIATSSIPPNRKFDFHFVVAYNAVDRDCDSEWFAVDVPHKVLTDLSSLTPVKWS